MHRWDYWRWHVNENILRFNLNAAIFLWESDDGRLAAVLHPDGAGEAVLQVRPDFHSLKLDLEMMAVGFTQYELSEPWTKKW